MDSDFIEVFFVEVDCRCRCMCCICFVARKRGKKMDALLLYYILSASFAAVCLVMKIRKRRRARRRTRRIWMRHWLRRRNDESYHTMTTLYNELLMVSIPKTYINTSVNVETSTEIFCLDKWILIRIFYLFHFLF